MAGVVNFDNPGSHLYFIYGPIVYLLQMHLHNLYAPFNVRLCSRGEGGGDAWTCILVYIESQ